MVVNKIVLSDNTKRVCRKNLKKQFDKLKKLYIIKESEVIANVNSRMQRHQL